MLRKWKAIGIMACLAAMVFLTISSNSPTPTVGAEATGTLAEILDRGYIKVGSDICYPPFEDYNPETGVAEGFDIDIMHVLANYISQQHNKSISVQFINSAWDPIIPNLQQEQFDVICSAMTITSDRELEVDFTRWYYKSSQGILVLKGNPDNITSTADLNDTTLTIGVQTGTTSYLWATEVGNITAEVMVYDDFPTALIALKQGSVDAVLGDLAVLNLDAVESGLTEVVVQFSPEDFGIACRNGDTDLEAVLDAGLKTLLGSDEANPVVSDLYNTIYYKWHGVSFLPYYNGTITDFIYVPYSWYEEDEDTPGFGFVVAMVVLAGSTLVIRRRRKP